MLSCTLSSVQTSVIGWSYSNGSLVVLSIDVKYNVYLHNGLYIAEEKEGFQFSSAFTLFNYEGILSELVLPAHLPSLIVFNKRAFHHKNVKVHVFQPNECLLPSSLDHIVAFCTLVLAQRSVLWHLVKAQDCSFIQIACFGVHFGILRKSLLSHPEVTQFLHHIFPLARLKWLTFALWLAFIILVFIIILCS